jgi:hypothetical protein
VLVLGEIAPVTELMLNPAEELYAAEVYEPVPVKTTPCGLLKLVQYGPE